MRVFKTQEVNLAKNIPKDLADLFQAMATDFPKILRENLDYFRCLLIASP